MLPSTRILCRCMPDKPWWLQLASTIGVTPTSWGLCASCAEHQSSKC